MINILHVRNNRIKPFDNETVAEEGDVILLSGKEEAPPFVQTNKNMRLHILFISPIGTIIDSDHIRLEETGYKKIYAFPITSDLYSGTYILQIDGDYKLREKINIRTDKQLLHRWFFSHGISIRNPNNEPLNNCIFDVMIPPNISPIQQISKIDCNYKPKELLSDKEGNRWIRFYFPQINPNELITIAYRAFIITRLVAYDITRIKDEEIKTDNLYPDVISKYTQPEKFIESNHPFIARIANNYRSFPPLGRALAILKYVRNKLEFMNLEGDFGAAYAIENGYGDCTEFAALFVALCRAANVPARLTTSVIITEDEGIQHHAQAEFFANGIWFPVDPTLQYDIRYFFRNPNCIILQRGNTLGDSSIREIRYRFDKMNSKQIIVHTHKDVNFDKNKIVGKINDSFPKHLNEIKGTLFENIQWKFSLPSIDLEKISKEIEIKITAPDTAPIHKPFSIPIHLYNRNKENIPGTLRISFVRGGIYTNHLYPLNLKGESHEPKMIEIPATNFLGKTLIEFIYQDENGLKIGYEQKKISFQ